jgi:hypothetical protein
MTCSSCRSRQRRISVILFLRQHGPDLTRHLVRKRDTDQHLWLPLQHATDPALRRYLMARAADDPAHGTNNQKPTNIGLSSLGYPTESFLAAGRILSWDKTQPGREVAPSLELGHVRPEGFNGQSRHWPDTGQGLQASRRIRLDGQFLEFLITRRDARRLLCDLRHKVPTLLAHDYWQVAGLGINQVLHALELPYANWKDVAVFIEGGFKNQVQRLM